MGESLEIENIDGFKRLRILDQEEENLNTFQNCWSFIFVLLFCWNHTQNKATHVWIDMLPVYKLIHL